MNTNGCVNCLSVFLFILFVLLLVGLIYWCFKPNRVIVDGTLRLLEPDSSPLPPE